MRSFLITLALAADEDAVGDEVKQVSKLLLLLLAYLHLQEKVGHGLDVCVDGELDYAEDKKCHHDTLLKHNWVIHLVSVHQKSDLSHVLNDESTDKSLKEACVYK